MLVLAHRLLCRGRILLVFDQSSDGRIRFLFHQHVEELVCHFDLGFLQKSVDLVLPFELLDLFGEFGNLFLQGFDRFLLGFVFLRLWFFVLLFLGWLGRKQRMGQVTQGLRHTTQIEFGIFKNGSNRSLQTFNVFDLHVFL